MMKILIVDDEEKSRYFLARLFSGSGHAVEEAADGKIALEMLEKEAYDLVISDILMPVMDGYALCRELRSREGLRETPFVFLTATYVDEKDERFALQLGADRFYRKPVDPRTFVREIDLLLEEIRDGKQRRLGPETDEKEILTLYNERLINKLEKKSSPWKMKSPSASGPRTRPGRRSRKTRFSSARSTIGSRTTCSSSPA